ncbi:MAG TPA: sigma-70 family RNA polymerase sigma factor [Flavobacteriales bacterium]|jgi:RNA polymerase sigma factor (sigma-70 family)
MTDQELANGCAAGKRDAQELLWKLYSRKMMTVCLRYCDSQEEAEDVLQEGFIKVFDKIGQWQGTGPLGGWIRTIMVNTALTYLRSRNKWRNTTDIETVQHIDAEEISAISRMNEQSLLELIEKMPSGYRTVFNLFAIEGYPHKEIAEMMGISENTSKTQFLKAKNWLKKHLTEKQEIETR